MAGIAGSNTYGVARGATIYAVRVLGTDGTGVTTDIVRGIQLVEDHAEQNPSMRFVIKCVCVVRRRFWCKGCIEGRSG